MILWTIMQLIILTLPSGPARSLDMPTGGTYLAASKRIYELTDALEKVAYDKVTSLQVVGTVAMEVKDKRG
jgi:hypothetical protein